MRNIPGIRQAVLLTAIYATPTVKHLGASTEEPVAKAVTNRQSLEATAPESQFETHDEAVVSHAADLIAEAMKMDDVRMDRVETLRQQIAEGYLVSANDVAGKMAESLLA